ncbi:MAG: DUF1636 domain-containing protein [Rubellimicrobium sp.]|nr:DUF1636 domain-containing protein [Rubellimicrobium sp.]
MRDATGLVVCTTCRHDDDRSAPDGASDGERLSAALSARGIPHQRQRCLAACKSGCVVVLRDDARWSFVQGGLHPEDDLEALIEMIGLWDQAPDGLVPWRSRPEAIRRNTIARIPPTETAP